MGREIERDRIYLDRTSQYAVDAFAQKVDRYNALNQEGQIANAAFNEKVGELQRQVAAIQTVIFMKSETEAQDPGQPTLRTHRPAVCCMAA